MSVDGAWERYRGDIDAGRALATEEALNLLLHEMTLHAKAIIWKECKKVRPDVVNGALMRALKGMSRFRGDSKFSTWFHEIVVNTLRRTLRQENTLAKREAPLEEAENILSPHAGENKVLELSNTLGVHDVDFFNRHEEGWNIHELGARFNLSPAGVRSRWRRIRGKLRKNLNDTI